VVFEAYVPAANESFNFNFIDASLFPAGKPTAMGGLILDGKVDTTRSTIMSTITTDGTRSVDTNLVILRSSVLKPNATADAVISTPYAYVGIDSAIGYDLARQNSDGTVIALPDTVHATPTDAAAAALSAGAETAVVQLASTATSTSSSKAKGTAKQSKAKTAKADVSKATLTDKVVTTPKSAAGKKLTLKMIGSSDDQKVMLDAAGLNVRIGKGALDIGGRIAHVDASDVVISAISGAQPELQPVNGVTGAAQLAATTGTTAKAKTAKKTTTTKKKSTATVASVVKASDATTDKAAVPQGRFTTADGKNSFPYTIKPAEVSANGKTVTGLYAEIGELTVGAGTEFQALSQHALVVHDLQLNNDLEVSVFVQDQITLTKLEKLTWDDVKGKKGQDLMTALKSDDHSISEVGLTGDQANPTLYSHYDSFTPFPLWVVKATVATGKSLKLTRLTLDTAASLSAGAYAYPLVKDLSASLPDSSGSADITLALDDSKPTTSLEAKEWKIVRNGHNDVVLLVNVAAKTSTGLSAGVFDRALMSSKAQGRQSVPTATLNAVVAKLDPTNLVSTSFANLSSSRLSQASQIASLARGVSASNAEKLGAVEQYSVTFNHAGAQCGLTYNLDGGNAFSSGKGATSFGANVASDVAGVKAIVSAEASVDAGKNAYASSSLASYNAGVTFAKAYSLGGLSVVPMGGFGVSSNALNSYSAVVPMAAGSLGLYMNDVSFTAATFHAGVNLALDDVVAAATGTTASLTLGVAGYLASSANATLSTSEGKSSDLQFGSNAVTPYAQFNLGFATGEKLNTMISSGIVAVNFGLDR
jgi:hypothetical protein